MRRASTPFLVTALALLPFTPCRPEDVPTLSADTSAPVLATPSFHQGPTSPPSATSEDDAGSQVEVWIHPTVTSQIRRRLEAALPVAALQLRDQATCRALFEEVGVDGLRTLEHTMYLSVSAAQERKLCNKTSAFTTVGGRATYLCRSYGRLPVDQAAVVLIHEALHKAGLGERPRDPQAMESWQISQTVRKSCRL